VGESGGSGTHLLVGGNERAEEVAVGVLVDELDVADEHLAVGLGLLEALLDARVGRDRLLLAVDVLQGVDEPVGGTLRAHEHVHLAGELEKEEEGGDAPLRRLRALPDRGQDLGLLLREERCRQHSCSARARRARRKSCDAPAQS